ncbi:hypothetical protein TRFO_38461 [Tritrichomonas foetus]|uniref:Uncharacterized protein n=1 Tax=Tritrichomonas foetus TaxID=1144522 RepID=A0A1J4J8F0_9EUKA|nr:hypothetical protein TRFO_38461 [Tritrichomonas foetus]|eukprot:OHS95454.1 hypothetical protein TRFO_38461 [Tritrichomonas foetus]
MGGTKQILSLERFDTYLEPAELLKNVKALAQYLSQQKTPFPVDQIRPTITYIIETEELMGTANDELQIQLAIGLVHAFRLSVPNHPFDQSAEKFLYRLFILLNNTFRQYSETDKQGELVELLQITNQIDLYALAKDVGLGPEIFSSLIRIDIPDAVDNIAKLVNVSDRIPPSILIEICEKFFTNKNVETLILKFNSLKQAEFVQGIRSTSQNLSGVDCIKIFEKTAAILRMPLTVLYSNIQVDINNEDVQTRTAAVSLLTEKFGEIDFDTSNQSCILSLIERHIDRESKIRAMVVRFGFNILLKIKEFKKNKELMKAQNQDIFSSAVSAITDAVWEMAKDRITDKTSEVRLTVMKGIYHLDARDIKLDEKMISLRLKDKNSDDVRVVALKIMLKLFESRSGDFEWLIEQVIELYPFSKDVALFGFAALVSQYSLIEVASHISNRKPLLDILRDTNEFRNNLEDYEKSKEKKDIISKHIDLRLLKKILKKVPKSFYQNALDEKKRKTLNKALKQKMEGNHARLIMGLYQPSPLNVDDLLKCKKYDVVYDIAKIFADEFEVEIPRILKRLNKTDLTVLATMKHTDFDDAERTKILKALVPLTTSNSKDRQLALKVFARLYQQNQNNSKLLSKISFDKKEFQMKLEFYGHFTDTNAFTKDLFDEIMKNKKLIDSDFAKSALKIISAEKSQRTIELHVYLMDIAPADTFRSYLFAASSCFTYITPDIFRSFAGIMQHENATVRKEAINYLTEALKRHTTPIQFLALFALSATDPVQTNLNEAKKQLEAAIHWRRNVLAQIKEYKTQIAPETALPYLINILAHHENFTEDLPDLATFSIYLRFFLTPLCADSTQYSFISEIFTRYSMLDDVEEEYTDNMVKLCNLGIIIVKELGKGKVWDQNFDDHLFEFSSRYFKQPTDDRDRLKKIMNQTGLESMKSPVRPRNLLRAGMEPLKSPRTRISTLDEEENSKGQSAPSSPMKRTKRALSRAQERAIAPKAKSALSTPRITKTKRKPSEEITSINDAPQTTPVKSPKKKVTESPKKKVTESPKKKVTESPKKTQAKNSSPKSSPNRKASVEVSESPKRKAADSPKKTTSQVSPKRKATESPKKTTSQASPKRKIVTNSPKKTTTKASSKRTTKK